MEGPKLEDFPPDEAAAFRPTHIFYLHETGSLKPTVAHDVTGATGIAVDFTTNKLTDGAQKAAQAAAAATSAKPYLELRRQAWYKRAYDAKDESDALVAEIAGPLLAFSHWILSFPSDSPHSSHAIEMRPTGMGSQVDVFAKDSVAHFWDVLDGRRLCHLWKVVGGKRIEVARYLSKGMHESDGILMVDGGGVDEVVAIMTCVAVLYRNESFRM